MGRFPVALPVQRAIASSIDQRPDNIALETAFRLTLSQADPYHPYPRGQMREVSFFAGHIAVAGTSGMPSAPQP
jgi:hypothetical protein